MGDQCKKCGKVSPRLGGVYPRGFCKCPEKRETSRKAPTQNITYVSPTPTIADQLVVLAKLHKEGSLTEQEFQTLKTRLISGGKS
jgi:hypothetical protein